MDILIAFSALYKSYVEYLDIWLQTSALNCTWLEQSTVCRTSKHEKFAGKDIVKSFLLSGLGKVQEHLNQDLLNQVGHLLRLKYRLNTEKSYNSCPSCLQSQPFLDKYSHMFLTELILIYVRHSSSCLLGRR